MASGDLTTLDAVRAYLKGQVPVPVDDETTLIPGLITAVSKMFASEAGSPILNTAQVQTWNGSGETKIFLEQYPVISVESVEVDGVAVPERTAVGESGWVLSSATTGKLELVGYAFDSGVANCVVNYTAGYGAAAPADVDQAVVDQVAYLYRQKDRVGVANESTQGGGSVSYLGAWQAQQGKAGQTPLFSATIERYRRVG